MSQPVQQQQSGFQGGLNISADASQLGPTQMRQAQNVRLTQFGGVLKRDGSRNIHTTAIGSGQPVRGLFAWEKDDASQQLLCIANGLVHYGTYGIPVSLTTATTTIGASVYPSFAAFRDTASQIVYIADGGKLLKWNGTTLTRSTSSPNVAQLWTYNQRLYGCSGVDAVLLASGLNNGDDLGDTTLNGVQVPIRTFGESSIVGGTALGVSNLIFHRGGISRWTGVTQDDIAISAGTLGVSPDTGTIVPASIVATETEVYFLSDRGFYAVNSAGLRRVSTTLDPDIFALFSTAANLCAVHNCIKREIEYYLPNTGIYSFNYQLQAWTGPWNGGYINPITHSMCKALDGNSSPIVLVGTANGFVKQMDYPDSYADNVLSDGTGGTAVNMVVQARRMFFGNPFTTVALRFLYCLAALNGSANAALGWVTNTSSGSQTLTQVGGAIWDTPSMIWDAFTWGSGDAAAYRVQPGGEGTYLDLTFTDSSTNALPLLSAMKAEGSDYGEPRGFN